MRVQLCKGMSLIDSEIESENVGSQRWNEQDIDFKTSHAAPRLNTCTEPISRAGALRRQQRMIPKRDVVPLHVTEILMTEIKCQPFWKCEFEKSGFSFPQTLMLLIRFLVHHLDCP